MKSLLCFVHITEQIFQWSLAATLAGTTAAIAASTTMTSIEETSQATE
jgi:hypothetical protein